MYSGERERREGGGVRWGRVRGGGGERDLSSVMPGSSVPHSSQLVSCSECAMGDNSCSTHTGRGTTRRLRRMRQVLENYEARSIK